MGAGVVVIAAETVMAVVLVQAGTVTAVVDPVLALDMMVFNPCRNGIYWFGVGSGRRVGGSHERRYPSIMHSIFGTNII